MNHLSFANSASLCSPNYFRYSNTAIVYVHVHDCVALHCTMYVIFPGTLLCRKITSSGRAHYSSGSFIVWSMKGKIFESLVCLCESFDYYSQYFIFLNVHCTLNTYFIAAEFCLLHLLELRHPTMFSQHFLECLFCFNSYQDHKGALQILGIFKKII